MDHKTDLKKAYMDSILRKYLWKLKNIYFFWLGKCFEISRVEGNLFRLKEAFPPLLVIYERRKVVRFFRDIEEFAVSKCDFTKFDEICKKWVPNKYPFACHLSLAQLAFVSYLCYSRFLTLIWQKCT